MKTVIPRNIKSDIKTYNGIFSVADIVYII